MNKTKAKFAIIYLLKGNETPLSDRRPSIAVLPDEIFRENDMEDSLDPKFAIYTYIAYNDDEIKVGDLFVQKMTVSHKKWKYQVVFQCHDISKGFLYDFAGHEFLPDNVYKVILVDRQFPEKFLEQVLLGVFEDGAEIEIECFYEFDRNAKAGYIDLSKKIHQQVEIKIKSWDLLYKEELDFFVYTHEEIEEIVSSFFNSKEFRESKNKLMAFKGFFWRNKKEDLSNTNQELMTSQQEKSNETLNNLLDYFQYSEEEDKIICGQMSMLHHCLYSVKIINGIITKDEPIHLDADYINFKAFFDERGDQTARIVYKSGGVFRSDYKYSYDSKNRLLEQSSKELNGPESHVFHYFYNEDKLIKTEITFIYKPDRFSEPDDFDDYGNPIYNYYRNDSDYSVEEDDTHYETEIIIFIYDDQTKLLIESGIKIEEQYIKKETYSYYQNDKVKEHAWYINNGSVLSKKHVYTYLDDNHSEVRKYGTNGDIFEVVEENKINNQLIKIIYEYKFTCFQKKVFTYDLNNWLVKYEIYSINHDLVSTVDELVESRLFEYECDVKGNWIKRIEYYKVKGNINFYPITITEREIIYFNL
ncbi:MAG: hypothetical protein NTX61_07090 [Bacteroidetes bacterium]|nr:hypothetical protein [Bacteroidota bacterium]